MDPKSIFHLFTKSVLQKLLDKVGVEYKKSLKKDKLIDLLCNFDLQTVLRQMNTKELKVILNEMELSSNGKKSVLIDRITEKKRDDDSKSSNDIEVSPQTTPTTSTKKDFKNILLHSLGCNSDGSFENYVQIGDYFYPQNAPVELKWNSEYSEFKFDNRFFFEEEGDAIRERLEAWGIDYDEDNDLEDEIHDFIEYGGPHWSDTRSGIQVKISRHWSSLKDLMLECDSFDIALADTMILTLPIGKILVPSLRFERNWKIDKSNRQGITGIIGRLTTTKSGELDRKGIEELLGKLKKEELSLERVEQIIVRVGLTLLGEKVWNNHLKMMTLHSSLEMVEVKAGSFLMGSPKSEMYRNNNETQHTVKLTRDFYMMKYLVTQTLWESVMKQNPSQYQGMSHPVDCVGWADCILFANILSEREGFEKVYKIPNELEKLCKAQMNCWDRTVELQIVELSKKVTMNLDANGYRLPTEAEWEYAARGGEDFIYPGSNRLDEVGWFYGNSEKGTHPVGKKKPNGYGLYDMIGNLNEWCWDGPTCYEEIKRYDNGTEYTFTNIADYETVNRVDPTGDPSSNLRVARGGCWVDDAETLRIALRDFGDGEGGFRLVRTKT